MSIIKKPTNLDIMLNSLDENLQASELLKIVGNNDEINRLLINHKNVNSEILNEIASLYNWGSNGYYDPTSLRLIAQSPKLDQKLAAIIGRKFTSDFIKNPNFYNLFSNNFELVEKIPEILENENCPPLIYTSIIDNGTKAQQYALMKNSKLSDYGKSKLTGNSFYNNAKIHLNKLIESQTDKKIQGSLRTYSGISLPYCLPKFLNFDYKNPSHRFSDQLMKGFPYTSKSFPWPASEQGIYLQPIAQINLKNASNLLNCDLGDGLLQIWGLEDDPELLQVRLISKQELAEPLDYFYPDDAPWLESEFYSLIDLNASKSDNQNPRLQWIYMGNMFLSSKFDTLYEINLGTNSWDINPSEFHYLLEDKTIPNDLYKHFEVSTNPSLRLGGFNDGDDYQRDFLVYPNDITDIRLILLIIEDWYEIGVLAKKDESKNIKFEAKIIFCPH